jgi:hypothetical protein
MIALGGDGEAGLMVPASCRDVLAELAADEEPEIVAGRRTIIRAMPKQPAKIPAADMKLKGCFAAPGRIGALAGVFPAVHRVRCLSRRQELNDLLILTWQKQP